MLLILILNGAINVLILQLFFIRVCVHHHPRYLYTFSYCKNDSNFGDELDIVRLSLTYLLK